MGWTTSACLLIFAFLLADASHVVPYWLRGTPPRPPFMPPGTHGLCRFVDGRWICNGATGTEPTPSEEPSPGDSPTPTRVDPLTTSTHHDAGHPVPRWNSAWMRYQNGGYRAPPTSGGTASCRYVNGRWSCEEERRQSPAVAFNSGQPMRAFPHPARRYPWLKACRGCRPRPYSNVGGGGGPSPDVVHLTYPAAVTTRPTMIGEYDQEVIDLICRHRPDYHRCSTSDRTTLWPVAADVPELEPITVRPLIFSVITRRPPPRHTYRPIVRHTYRPIMRHTYRPAVATTTTNRPPIDLSTTALPERTTEAPSTTTPIPDDASSPSSVESTTAIDEPSTRQPTDRPTDAPIDVTPTEFTTGDGSSPSMVTETASPTAGQTTEATDEILTTFPPTTEGPLDTVPPMETTEVVDVFSSPSTVTQTASPTAGQTTEATDEILTTFPPTTEGPLGSSSLSTTEFVDVFTSTPSTDFFTDETSTSTDDITSDTPIEFFTSPPTDDPPIRAETTPLIDFATTSAERSTDSSINTFTDFITDVPFTERPLNPTTDDAVPDFVTNFPTDSPNLETTLPALTPRPTVSTRAPTDAPTDFFTDLSTQSPFTDSPIAPATTDSSGPFIVFVTNPPFSPPPSADTSAAPNVIVTYSAPPSTNRPATTPTDAPTLPPPTAPSSDFSTLLTSGEPVVERASSTTTIPDDATTMALDSTTDQLTSTIATSTGPPSTLPPTEADLSTTTTTALPTTTDSPTTESSSPIDQGFSTTDTAQPIPTTTTAELDTAPPTTGAPPTDVPIDATSAVTRYATRLPESETDVQVIGPPGTYLPSGRRPPPVSCVFCPPLYSFEAVAQPPPPSSSVAAPCSERRCERPISPLVKCVNSICRFIVQLVIGARNGSTVHQSIGNVSDGGAYGDMPSNRRGTPRTFKISPSSGEELSYPWRRAAAGQPQLRFA